MVDRGLAKGHNDAVRWMILRASESLAEIDNPSVEQSIDAVVDAIGDHAQRIGVDRNAAVRAARGQIIYQAERYGSNAKAMHLRNYVATKPGAVAAAAQIRAKSAPLEEAIARRKAARAAHGDSGAANSMVLTLDDAVADVIAAGTISGHEWPTAVATTDTVADGHAPSFNTATQDTLYQVEDITDSSRVLWEEAMLAAWIEADGDTTIFAPLYGPAYSMASADCAPTEGTFPGPSGEFPAVVACPPCIAAAIGVAGTDAVTAYNKLTAGETGLTLLNHMAGASLIATVTAGAIANVGGIAGFVSRAGSWLKGLFTSGG